MAVHRRLTVSQQYFNGASKIPMLGFRQSPANGERNGKVSVNVQANQTVSERSALFAVTANNISKGDKSTAIERRDMA